MYQKRKKETIPALSRHRIPESVVIGLRTSSKGIISTTLPVRQKIKSTKIHFLGPETAGWGGGFPREGVGLKVRAIPRKFVFLGFGRLEGRSLECPGNFRRDVPDPWGCSKSLCHKKKFVRIVQDTFDHDKGHKSTILRRRLHWIFLILSGVFFLPFFPFTVCNLVGKWPQNVEKKARCPGGEQSVGSCHISGCYGFSVPNFSFPKIFW